RMKLSYRRPGRLPSEGRSGPVTPPMAESDLGRFARGWRTGAGPPRKVFRLRPRREDKVMAKSQNFLSFLLARPRLRCSTSTFLQPDPEVQRLSGEGTSAPGVRQASLFCGSQLRSA